MDEIGKLAEMHIRESESHLRHIDEMMARANQSREKIPASSDTESRLTQIKQDRDRLEQELVDIRKQPVDGSSTSVKRGEDLKGVLGTLGLQLEQVLATVFLHGEK